MPFQNRWAKKGGKCKKASHILISYEGTKVPNKKNNEQRRNQGEPEALLIAKSDQIRIVSMLAFLTQMIHQRSKVEI
jgi:hypothetical protein